MSQSMYFMAFHESRRKRLLKLFRRAKGRDDDTADTQRAHESNGNGSWREASAIDNSTRNFKPEQASSSSQATLASPQRNLSPHNTAASQVGNYQLPSFPRDREFSSNFQGLTLDSPRDGCVRSASNSQLLSAYLDEGYNSERIADRNMSTSALETPSIRLLPQKRKSSELVGPPLIPNLDTHSGNVAGRINGNPVVQSSQNDDPSPLKVSKRNSNLNDAPSSQPKGEDLELRDASWSITPLGMEGSQAKPPFDEHKIQKPRDASWSITPLAMEGYEDRSPFESGPNTPTLEHSRSSIDKPLPPTPSTTAPRTPTSATNKQFRRRSVTNASGHGKNDSVDPMNLDDATIYRHADTVSIHEEQAPAVKHEQILDKQDEVRQQVITREVHDYDIYHRILPIKDIEVKPARHFAPVQDGYIEIDEDDLPGRTRQKTNWAVAEFVTKSMPDMRSASSARRFTARNFQGTEGDDREYIGPDGYPVKEKWWVHPPTLEENTASTYPFHFGSENPKDDGLKAKLPAGNVIGASQRLTEKRNEPSTERSF